MCDVLWLATELIVTGHGDTAEALLHADDEDTDMALTIVQRDTLLQVLDDPPQRPAQLRAALLDEQTWGDLI
jgi:uncharacterized protein (DUF1778 family)